FRDRRARQPRRILLAQTVHGGVELLERKRQRRAVRVRHDAAHAADALARLDAPQQQVTRLVVELVALPSVEHRLLEAKLVAEHAVAQTKHFVLERRRDGVLELEIFLELVCRVESLQPEHDCGPILRSAGCRLEGGRSGAFERVPARAREYSTRLAFCYRALCAPEWRMYGTRGDGNDAQQGTRGGRLEGRPGDVQANARGTRPRRRDGGLRPGGHRSSESALG